ncbi:MAG TPA: acyl-ACP--UDP-N-acetylglucosamine O-acyltransferase [Planctomycetota bacterium]|nr:acyl-ACP--UDP-N-acetylglucosamine O-acyltransferase [Planctomycetota bacterium]
MAQPKVHPRAIVDPGAILHDDVEVGPGAVIEAGAEIGAGSRIGGNAYVYGGTAMGERNVVHPGAIIGGPPQDHHYKGEKSFLRIGSANIFREFCSVNRGTGEGASTVIGDRNFLLVSSHVGHNAVIGNDCIIEGAAMIAGHVTLEDRVLIAGLAGVHQFCRIGKLAMIGFAGGVSQDLPPYMTAVGVRPFYVVGPNVVGLRRAKVEPKSRAAIKRAYKLVCRSGLPLPEVLAELEKEAVPEVQHIATFIKASKKGVIRRGTKRGSHVDAEAGSE